MTLLLYARRKGWPVESVTVELSHERAEERSTWAPTGGRETADLIRVSPLVKGQLTEEQQKQLRGVASRCPIHRTLSNPPRLLEEMDVVA